MLEVTVKIAGFDEEGNPQADVQQEIITGVIHRIAGHIEDSIRKSVELQFQKTIAEKLASSIEDYLAKPIHKTNEYGEKKGESKTLVEIIAEGGAKYLAESVNDRGTRPDYSDTPIPRAEFISRQMAAEVLGKELRPIIEKAKADAKSFMVNNVTTALKEAMAKAIQ